MVSDLNGSTIRVILEREKPSKLALTFSAILTGVALIIVIWPDILPDTAADRSLRRFDESLDRFRESGSYGKTPKNRGD